jgi:hypothetical protein
MTTPWSLPSQGIASIAAALEIPVSENAGTPNDLPRGLPGFASVSAVDSAPVDSVVDSAVGGAPANSPGPKPPEANELPFTPALPAGRRDDESEEAALPIQMMTVALLRLIVVIKKIT